MDKKPRYSVMLDGDRTVYSGNSRFVAWTFWLMEIRWSRGMVIFSPDAL